MNKANVIEYYGVYSFGRTDWHPVNPEMARIIKILKGNSSSAVITPPIRRGLEALGFTFIQVVPPALG